MVIVQFAKLMPFNVTRMVYGFKVLIDV